MKKFLSLALVAVMLLSTLMFTSCDVNSLMEMLGGSFGSATTPAETTPAETTPEETTPPAPKRYTITEAEWEAILNSTNYTWRISNDYVADVFVTANAAQQTEYDGDISMTGYFEYKNGAVYQLIDHQSNGEWVAFKTSLTDWNQFSLGKTVGLDGVKIFEGFQYNEATKSYIYEEDGDKAEFFFEDGKLIKATATNGTNPDSYWVIENVGTTVVTLPEYTVAEE